MLFGKISEKDSANKRSAKNTVSVLSRGCSFSGKIVLEGQSHLGGVFEGEVISKGFLCVEETACLEGELKVVDAEIRGTVSGSVVSTGLLKLTASAAVTGDIIAHRVMIEEGATINARIKQYDDIDEIEAESDNLLLETASSSKNDASEVTPNMAN
jgi:cytoskeletal protein CcmA (bactofilin family)